MRRRRGEKTMRVTKTSALRPAGAPDSLGVSCSGSLFRTGSWYPDVGLPVRSIASAISRKL